MLPHDASRVQRPGHHHVRNRSPQAANLRLGMPSWQLIKALCAWDTLNLWQQKQQLENHNIPEFLIIYSIATKAILDETQNAAAVFKKIMLGV